MSRPRPQRRGDTSINTANFALIARMAANQLDFHIPGWQVTNAQGRITARPPHDRRPVPPPVAFTAAGFPYFDSSQAKVDITNGYIFHADTIYHNVGTLGDSTTLNLNTGINYVYVNLDWGQGSPAVTFVRMSSNPTPSDSDYKHWLFTLDVDATNNTITRTYTAHPGGNIYIPGAFAP